MNIIVVDKRKYAMSSETNGILYLKGLYNFYILYFTYIFQTALCVCVCVCVYIYVCCCSC